MADSNPELQKVKELIDTFLFGSVSEETRALITKLVYELNL
jgi:hypothetical protein